MAVCCSIFDRIERSPRTIWIDCNTVEGLLLEVNGGCPLEIWSVSKLLQEAPEVPRRVRQAPYRRAGQSEATEAKGIYVEDALLIART